MERDHSNNGWFCVGINFNSHAHVERDSIFARLNFKCSNFNSHAHVERDQFQLLAVVWPCKFQLTRSRGAWQFQLLAVVRPCKFQLTRSRGAWRGFYKIIFRNFKFQLTRSRGAWLSPFPLFLLDKCHFNSHAHVERDLLLWFIERMFDISTHTLTWSVTRCQ